MDVIEGTDIGQANRPQPSQNSVGSAFAALNPPMSHATKVKCNPVGEVVTRQMRDLLDRIDTATSKTRSRLFLDADWSEGYDFADGSSTPSGPSPTGDCTRIKVGIALHGELDATRPLIPQIVAWLEKQTDQLGKTIKGVATVREKRDIRALRVLIAETEVIA